MFSRVVDLYRIDILLRSLERKAQHEIMRRLGCLKIVLISVTGKLIIGKLSEFI